MNRKEFLVGLGAASAGGSILLGSGAFSRVESDRDLMISVAEDPDAYLGLDACDSAHGDNYVDIDDYGHLHVDIGDSGNEGKGVNSNSRTWFDDVFQICNQGKEDAYVWLADDENWPTVESGPYEGDPRVEFYVNGESIVGPDNAYHLELGECTCVGIKTNTHGLDATETESLLEDIDDVLTIVADVSPPDDEEPPEMAFFEVSNLDPMDATVEQGDIIDVSATITNTGDLSGEQYIQLLINGDLVDEALLSLEAGDSEVVTFEDVDTSDLEPGEYTHEIASEDDSQSGTLTVEEDEPPEVLDWNRDLDELGLEADPEAATDWDNYEVTQIGDNIDSLMSIDVDDDGRVWYITRGAPFVSHGDGVAEIGYVDPNSGDQQTALELDVIVGADVEPINGEAREIGGQGIAIDPDFEENGYVYIYYHPAVDDLEFIDNPYHEDITTALQQISRFEYDDGALDPDSEETLIQVPFQLTTCCHYGGYLEFGPEGDLYISTGDDSNNVGAPNRPEVDYFMGDERQEIVGGRPAAVSDAQRTSGNTADLRGSILRVTPEDDGGYSIPDGNLKDTYEEEFDVEVDDEEFLPEIYALGFRNPYVINADEYTGALWVSDYSHDASGWDNELGFTGIATHYMICDPIYGGWPYFKGYYPTRYRDFEREEHGQPFWIDNVRNRSPNNTGVERLPDFTPATLWQSRSGWGEYTNVPAWADMPRPGEASWPEMPEGGSANAGIAYRYSDDFGEGALDPYFEGKQFIIAPYSGGYIGYVGFDEDGSVDIEQFLPDHDFVAPTDMDVLPDGRLVLMDYGGPWDGSDGGIFLIEYDETDEEEPDELVEAPYGANIGGEPQNEEPLSELPVEIGGLEFENVQDVDAIDDLPYMSVFGDDPGEGWFTPPAQRGGETDQEIANTEHGALYQTYLFGYNLGFEIGIENGTYDVIFHNSENWWEDEEERLFDITVNGETVIENYDIYAEVGDHTAHTVVAEGVEVDDETLLIETETHEDMSKFAGIEIRETVDENGAIEPGTTIDLDGQTGGWIGIAPEEIEGVQNPTLTLEEGEEYTIGWSTGDGGFHNIAIRDEGASVVDDLQTSVTNEPDEDQFLTFIASEEMADYVCQPHAGSMVGEIDVV